MINKIENGVQLGLEKRISWIDLSKAEHIIKIMQ